jgi:uncharacterized protein (DUF302 family)
MRKVGVVVTKVSPWTVDQTVCRLVQIVRERGLKVFVVVDHSGEARAAGLDLRDTKVVLFGSPTTGTSVMSAAPLVALDLPLKVLVWADGDRTKVCYAPPSELADRYGISDDLAARFAGIEVITDELVRP